MPDARIGLGSTLVYETNGGDAISSAFVANKAAITLTEDLLPTPVKAGYSFAGWYTSPTFEEDTKAEVGTTLQESGNLTPTFTIYAKWTADGTTEPEPDTPEPEPDTPVQGIPAQIQRITEAVEDIKSAITEKGGTVPEDAQVDDLADIIRTISTGSSEAKVFAGAIDPGDLTEAQMEEMGLGVGDVYIYVPGME